MQVCVVVVALDTITSDLCPDFLYGSHRWPKFGVPRNLDQLQTWSTSLERGDCVAFHLDAAWISRREEEVEALWRSKTAVLVFGDDGTGVEGGEVWVDELRGSRGYTPTSVVQWSKGVPPPDQEHYN